MQRDLALLCVSEVAILLAEIICGRGGFHSYDGIKAIGITLGSFCLKEAMIAAKIKAIQASARVLSAIPFIGNAIFAIGAALVVAGLAATIIEVFQSPWTYANRLSLTHDLNVKVSGDPKGTRSGMLPVNASKYQLIAKFNNSSPVVTDMMSVTETDRNRKYVEYAFRNIPYGGKVQIDIVFYTSTNCPVGKGSTGSIQNTIDSTSFAIVEVPTPLDNTSRYVHNKKTSLDSGGNHIWIQTSQSPPVDDLRCGIGQGQLCELVSLTVNRFNEALGYSWKSYTNSCSGGSGQLYRFANMPVPNSDTQYRASNCGYQGTVRLVYDPMGSAEDNFYLDTSSGKPLVRQIRFMSDGGVEIDDSSSNRC